MKVYIVIESHEDPEGDSAFPVSAHLSSAAAHAEQTKLTTKTKRRRYMQRPSYNVEELDLDLKVEGESTEERVDSMDALLEELHRAN